MQKFILLALILGLSQPAWAQSEKADKAENPEIQRKIESLTQYSYSPLLPKEHAEFKEAVRRNKKFGKVTSVRSSQEYIIQKVGFKKGEESETVYRVKKTGESEWHSFDKNPFIDKSAKGLYTGNAALDTPLFFVDLLTFFSLSLGTDQRISDFTKNRKEQHYFNHTPIMNDRAQTAKAFHAYVKEHGNTKETKIKFLKEHAPFLTDVRDLDIERLNEKYKQWLANREALNEFSAAELPDEIIALYSLTGQTEKLVNEVIKEANSAIEGVNALDPHCNK